MQGLERVGRHSSASCVRWARITSSPSAVMTNSPGDGEESQPAAGSCTLWIVLRPTAPLPDSEEGPACTGFQSSMVRSLDRVTRTSSLCRPLTSRIVSPAAISSHIGSSAGSVPDTMRRPASITHASAEGGVLGAAVDSVRGVSCSCSALAKETHGQMVSSIARCWTSRAACVLGPSNLQHATHLGWAESTNMAWLGSAVLQRIGAWLVSPRARLGYNPDGLHSGVYLLSVTL